MLKPEKITRLDVWCVSETTPLTSSHVTLKYPNRKVLAAGATELAKPTPAARLTPLLTQKYLPKKKK